MDGAILMCFLDFFFVVVGFFERGKVQVLLNICKRNKRKDTIFHNKIILFMVLPFSFQISKLK